jgi:hypothetical protein
MGLAIDTIVTSAINPGAGPTAFTTAVSGDSLTVRNFRDPATARLIQMIRRGATTGFFRVRSPLLHDNIRGIMFSTGQTPSLFPLPEESAQLLYAQDTLTAEGSGGGAETDLGCLVLAYSDLPGVQARLHTSADINPLIVNIKPVTIAITTSATIGVWTDTVITTTEDLMKANTDYAILGFITSVALGIVAVKGSDTGNLRVGGPGSINVEDTSDYFVQQADYHGMPFIPVINSANKGALFVSTVDSAASTAATITLIMAQLSQQVTP